MRRRTFVGAMALSAALGVLASFGVASASTLEVDGGVLQTWDLSVDVPVVEVPNSVAPAMEDVPDASDDEPPTPPAADLTDTDTRPGDTELDVTGTETDLDSDGPGD